MPQVPSSVNQQRMIAMASQNQPAMSSDEQRSYAMGAAMAAQNQPAANSRTLLGTVGDVVENAVTAPPKLALGLVGNTLSGVGGMVSGVGNFLAGR
jgi:hypothetical protein